jgi:hypothetical protein
LTTVGLAVWLVRLWVLLLDAIPVAFKAMMSLRAQRPYDTMVAAHAAAELKLAHQIARSTPAPHSHIPAEPIEPPAEPSKPNGDRPNGSGPTLGATGRSLRASSNAQLVRRLAATHPDWTQAKLGETVGLSTRQVRRYLTSTSNGHEPDPQQAGHETGHRTGHEADITPDTKNESALVTRQPGIVR